MSRTIYLYSNGETEYEFDEDRIDAIGRNGGEGLHYPTSLFHDCAEFLRAGDTQYPDLKNADLYETLIGEEYNEWRLELKKGSPGDVKEALDLLYVTAQYLNTVIGPDKALECWNLLHENNMSKCVDGKLLKRSDGKILKPFHYVPLDLTEVLQ